MKKLITIMATAATALFAFGADEGFISGTSLEALNVGALPTDKNDAGTEYANTYWYFDGGNEAELLVTNYEAGVELPPRPKQFAEDSNDKYLKIETSTNERLYRSIGVNSQNTSFPNKESIGDGIYLDTLVQFSAADGQFKDNDVISGDKIAIEYVEHDADETTGDVGYTNFVVRAGYVVGQSIVATNYFLTFPDQAADEVQFDKTKWHRLTVRAISNVGNANAPVGFVVYVDDTNLVYKASVSGGSTAAGDAAYVESLNSVVQTYLYNNETHALLPSLLRKGETDYNTLSAVAFTGTGSVDDIAFTGTTPTFIVEGTAVTIAWDANVATYTVVAGEDTLINAEAVSGAGSTNLLLDTSVATLTVTATYATGYEAGTWTVTGSGAAISGSTFTVAPGAQLDIVSMLPLFQVGETHYGTFAEALAAAVAASKTTDPWTSVTIKALADIDEGISFTDGDIVLDLNGKTLQGTIEEYTINNSGAILTIIDSASGGTVLAPSGEASTGALYMDNGATVINAGRFEGNVITQKMDEGDGADDLTLNGGVFADSLYNPEDAEAKFYLYGYLGTDVKATYNAGYFTVGSNTPEPPTPTSVEAPTAASNLVYDGTEQTGVATGTGYTLSGTYAATDAGDYTATATLEEGYIWSDSTTEAKSINWSIAADDGATVDVTLSADIAEYSAQLAFPTATATIGGNAVAGTPVWDPATITEPAAGATNTYTVTFTVTTANYAGSTGTATFKVFKAAQSGGWDPKPEEIDPSATAATKYPELAETALATANAQKLTAWAEENKVDFAAVKASADTYVDAYLLNCAPDEVEAAQADFKATITVNADGTVTVTAPGDYNVTPTIQGKQTLSDSEEWHAKTDDDQFFRAVLSL